MSYEFDGVVPSPPSNDRAGGIARKGGRGKRTHSSKPKEERPAEAGARNVDQHHEFPLSQHIRKTAPRSALTPKPLFEERSTTSAGRSSGRAETGGTLDQPSVDDISNPTAGRGGGGGGGEHGHGDLIDENAWLRQQLQEATMQNAKLGRIVEKFNYQVDGLASRISDEGKLPAVARPNHDSAGSPSAKQAKREVGLRAPPLHSPPTPPLA